VERREFIAMLASTPAATLPNADADTQSAAPAAAPKPLSVTLLGTGTPSPSLDRQSSGYLIEVGHDLIVWDHGPGAHHRLLQSGHRSVDVTHAFFTHLRSEYKVVPFVTAPGAPIATRTTFTVLGDEPGLHEE